jgi:hypothetical protein
MERMKTAENANAWQSTYSFRGSDCPDLDDLASIIRLDASSEDGNKD